MTLSGEPLHLLILLLYFFVCHPNVYCLGPNPSNINDKSKILLFVNIVLNLSIYLFNYDFVIFQANRKVSTNTLCSQ